MATVRELRAISHSDRKSDDVDAEKLARYARLDPDILRPISHRTVEQQQAFTLIRARELLVRLRTAAVNAVRGLTKACGHRMPASSTKCFALLSTVESRDAWITAHYPAHPGCSGKAKHTTEEANRRVHLKSPCILVHARRWKVPLAFGKARLTDRRACR